MIEGHDPEAGANLLPKIAAALELPGDLATADKYRMQADPALMKEVVVALSALIPREVEVLVGLELGGVPLAVALSLATGLRSAVLRRSAKPGAGTPFAGEPVVGRRVALVVDMLQGGGKLTAAVQAIRLAGAVVEHALVAVYWHPSAKLIAEQVGVELLACVTSDQVAAQALS